jgi:hypothetical protein
MQRTPFRIGVVAPEDIFSGLFTTQRKVTLDEADRTLKEWLKPIGGRVTQSELENEAEWNSRCDDMAEGMADYMLHRSNRTNTGGAVATAKKFLTEKEKAVLAGDYDRSLVKKPVVPLPKGAPLR